jgi:hypothetical protein
MRTFTTLGPRIQCSSLVSPRRQRLPPKAIRALAASHSNLSGRSRFGEDSADVVQEGVHAVTRQPALSSTLSGDDTSGSHARPSAEPAGWWATAIRRRYVGRDWVPIGQGVAIGFMEYPLYAVYIAGRWLFPGPEADHPLQHSDAQASETSLFRHDLMALPELHYQHRIKPFIAHRFPLADARRAQELLAKGGVVGKIVLLRDAPSAAA